MSELIGSVDSPNDTEQGPYVWFFQISFIC